jgi:hypothetical protein
LPAFVFSGVIRYVQLLAIFHSHRREEGEMGRDSQDRRRWCYLSCQSTLNIPCTAGRAACCAHSFHVHSILRGKGRRPRSWLPDFFRLGRHGSWMLRYFFAALVPYKPWRVGRCTQAHNTCQLLSTRPIQASQAEKCPPTSSETRPPRSFPPHMSINCRGGIPQCSSCVDAIQGVTASPVHIARLPCGER